MDQDLADALALERFLTVAGQKADQSITGSPMPFQTNTRLIEKKAQDAGPGPDEDSDEEDEQKEPSTGPGLDEAGGASEGGGQPPPKQDEIDFDSVPGKKTGDGSRECPQCQARRCGLRLRLDPSAKGDEAS